MLKYPLVQRITLVDMDPAMTTLASSYPAIVRLNEHSLSNPRLRVLHQDAFSFLRQDGGRYDVIIADLPDPDKCY